MASSSRPASRSRRAKSATARMITPPPPPTELGISSIPLTESVKETKDKRGTSAKANKEKNESSKKVFPGGGGYDKKERYLSIYNKDYEGTYMMPTEPRPTSPTRRNNPHPSQVCVISHQSFNITIMFFVFMFILSLVLCIV